MKKPGPYRGRVLPFFWALGLLIAIPVAVVSFGARPAAAANVVNTTIHVPAQVQTNPCYPTDVVNLSGDIHIVQTVTASSSGGYHEVDQLNSQLSGASITTGTKYVNNENKSDEWYAGPPFPTIHTQTYDFILIAQGNTPNYVLHMTLHETITANGTPTATVDSFSMDCQG